MDELAGIKAQMEDLRSLLIESLKMKTVATDIGDSNPRNTVTHNVVAPPDIPNEAPSQEAFQPTS